MSCDVVHLRFYFQNVKTCQGPDIFLLSWYRKSMEFNRVSRACERSWAVRIPAPHSRGCSLPRSTAQSHRRPLRSFPLPAHLQFHPAPVKSLHARSHLKFLCMPNTCRFQPKPWDTLSAWRTWSGFVLRNCCGKIRLTSILSWGRGCGVFGPRTWCAHIPQAVWLL